MASRGRGLFSLYIYIENFKNLLVRNHWIDFMITSGLRLNDGLFVKLKPVGWGLTICLWLGLPWFNYWFSFTLAYSRISHEYSSLFIIVINLIFMFRFDALTKLGAFMRTEFLCIYVLRVASGPRVKLASCKSALNSPVVCSTDRSKAVVPVLVLLLVALWFILRGDLLYVFPCVILFLCFSVL